MVERLRGRGCQPRKVGHDLWESKCPGHGSADHALAFGRSADGKLEVERRSIENCSLSRIVKKLDLKLERLFTDTQPSLIRRLQAMEIQPSIYERSDPVVPALVDSPDTAAGDEPIATTMGGSCRLTVAGWPKTPNTAATELRRIAPLLRTVGLSVTFERGTNGTRLVAIAATDRDGMPAARRA